MTNKVTPFGEVLADLNAGTVENSLTIMLREAARHVAQNQKKGMVSLTLALNPVKGSEDIIAVASTVKFSRPTPSGSRSEDTTHEMNLYVDASGNLSVTPHVQTLNIKVGDEVVAVTPAGAGKHYAD